MAEHVLPIRARRPSPPRRRRRRGLGLAEMLVAGAVVAALLAAVATAADAGFRTYAANQVRADTTQRARITMDRLLAVIRTTEDHAPATPGVRPDFTSGLVVTDSGIVMLDNAGQAIGWRFDAGAGQLVYDAPGGTPHVMLRGVRDFRVTLEPMRSYQSLRAGGSYDRLRRATVLLTVGLDAAEVGNVARAAGETITLSASVAPRRNVGL